MNMANARRMQMWFAKLLGKLIYVIKANHLIQL